MLYNMIQKIIKIILALIDETGLWDWHMHTIV